MSSNDSLKLNKIFGDKVFAKWHSKLSYNFVANVEAERLNFNYKTRLKKVDLTLTSIEENIHQSVLWSDDFVMEIYKNLIASNLNDKVVDEVLKRMKDGK